MARVETKTSSDNRPEYDEYFKIDDNYGGEWNFNIFSYTNNPKNPISIYRYNSRRKQPEGITQSRRIKYCTAFIFFDTNVGLVFDNNIYYPASGDCIIIKANEKFSSYFTQSNFENSCEFVFPLDYFETVSKNNLFYKMFYEFTGKGPLIIPTDIVSREEIKNKISLMEEIVLSKDENKDIIMYSYLIQIFGIIYSQNTPGNESILSKFPKKLKEGIDYIHQNFTHIETIEEVADACNISMTYLARIFKESLACSPTDYLTTIRISYAQKLLSQGKNITEACNACGFNNYTYFIKKFKAFTGITPKKFQKK